MSDPKLVVSEFLDGDVVEEVSNELIESIPEINFIKPARIKYLLVNKEKLSYMGKITRPTGIWKYLTGYDYVMQVWAPLVDLPDKKMLRATVLHELAHIDLRETKSGDEWSLKDHDIQELMIVTKYFGLYNDSLKTMFNSYNSKDLSIKKLVEMQMQAGHVNKTPREDESISENNIAATVNSI
jgi:hypothetical protein